MSDFLEDWKKLEQKRIAVLERLEKAGTLQKFLDELPTLEPSWEHLGGLPSIWGPGGYQEIKESCQAQLADYLLEAQTKLQMARFVGEHPTRLYEGYAQRQAEIKASEILDYLRDFEDDPANAKIVAKNKEDK